MKREIYEFEIVNEKMIKSKKGIIVEIDINNYAKIEFGMINFYEADIQDQSPPHVKSSTNIVVGKVESIEDLINLLKPYYPNLVKENLTLLSSVAWTDWDYKPAN